VVARKRGGASFRQRGRPYEEPAGKTSGFENMNFRKQRLTHEREPGEQSRAPRPDAATVSAERIKSRR
jgi:hypothetical protein